MNEYYKELELQPGASLEEITQSYRRLISLYHPDRHPGPASEELTKRLNLAFTKLQEYIESPEVYETYEEPEVYETYEESVPIPEIKKEWTDYIETTTIGIVLLVGGAFSILILGILYKIFIFLFRLIFL
jgi:preprotein translocase subunit Sec63